MNKRANSVICLALLFPPIFGIGFSDIFRGIEGEVRQRVNEAIRETIRPSKKSPANPTTPTKPGAEVTNPGTGFDSMDELERHSRFMNETWGKKFAFSGTRYDPISTKTKLTHKIITFNDVAAMLEGYGFKRSQNERSEPNIFILSTSRWQYKVEVMGYHGKPISGSEDRVGIIHFPGFDQTEDDPVYKSHYARVRLIIDWWAQNRYDSSIEKIDQIVAASLAKLETRSIKAEKICGRCTINAEGTDGAPGIHSLIIADEEPFGLIYISGETNVSTHTAKDDFRVLTSIAF
jgi:hypothetical protein